MVIFRGGAPFWHRLGDHGTLLGGRCFEKAILQLALEGLGGQDLEHSMRNGFSSIVDC